MTFHSTALLLALVAAIGLTAAGCQSTAIAMDDPWAYNSATATPASLNAHCSTSARDAVVWGTLPSAWCAPYGPSAYWSGPAGPGFYYGRPYGRTWRGFGWHQHRGYSGRGYGGGWRGGGRGGRR
jgi:hypothetical protein